MMNEFQIHLVSCYKVCRLNIARPLGNRWVMGADGVAKGSTGQGITKTRFIVQSLLEVELLGLLE